MSRSAITLLASLVLFACPSTAATPSRPIEVMIVGSYHMSNPGKDIHDVKADDVLTPKRQKEIAGITDALARFKPTKVAVEWPQDLVAERYPKYLSGTLAPSRNEVVQLGFRLARDARAQGVWGLDVDGDFPYERLLAYAKAHGQSALMDYEDAQILQSVNETNSHLGHGTIAEALGHINDPAIILRNHQFYRRILKIGGGAEQPGAELAAAWYKTNFLICAGLLQLAKPGDRIVVFYGSGHAHLLRQCVTESPGLKLIEANRYLPK